MRTPKKKLKFRDMPTSLQYFMLRAVADAPEQSITVEDVMERFALAGVQPNAGTIYRTVKQLAERKWVKIHREIIARGTRGSPSQSTMTLTPAGSDAIAMFDEFLAAVVAPSPEQ